MHVLVQHMSANGDHLSAESLDWSVRIAIIISCFFTRCFRSDLDAAAAAAAAMGLEMPSPVLSKSALKVKQHNGSKAKSAADSKTKGSEVDSDKRREDLRSTGVTLQLLTAPVHVASL